MNYKFDDLQHLHTLGGKPLTGTSSVGNVLYKPLQWWSAELAAVECLEAGEKIPTIREEYEEAVKSGDKKTGIRKLQEKYPLFKKARYAHFDTSKKAAKEGTDLHEELEHFVKAEMGKLEHKEYDEQIKPFIDWSKENVKKFLWSEAHCYSECLWVGGISDAGAELKDGRRAVIDFKRAKSVYTTHFIQTAGYAIEINENGLISKDGEHSKKVKKLNTLIVVPFGAEKVIPEIKPLEDYVKGFESAVLLYRIIGLEKNGKS